MSDLLLTVKSQEAQRAMLAESRNDRHAANLHFLAAAQLELVIAEDYRTAGDAAWVLRSQVSAATYFWRGGEMVKGKILFDSIMRELPDVADRIGHIVEELTRDYPPSQA